MLGVPLALTDYGSTLDWIDASIAARRPGYICVAAVHTVMASQEDLELREAVLLWEGRVNHAGIAAEAGLPYTPLTDAVLAESE